ncbi:MAG: Asp-tRNA(Asn)/Glu-tRNA(Gln) amidotransferase subunit GatC [Thermodesulfobacteriota bacterium]|nr:Asp-tRNA(Asn)/Glu-tRNA(Gln) amidotransferase subunit GatC [Thermodesulfobacteriota bacterium]
MKINKATVEKIAGLARLKLSEEQKELFTHQLDSILTYFEKLNELDTKDIPPTTHAIANVNVFKEDEVKESLSTESALLNAPEKDKGFFLVPQVIE